MSTGRFPGESLVRYYNRRLQERGRFDVEWYEIEGGQLRLRDVQRRQERMEFGS